MEAMCMGMSHMDCASGEVINSVSQMFGKFSGEVCSMLSEWEGRLHDAPELLEEIESEVKILFLRGAGMISAGLIAAVLLSEDLAKNSETTRKQFSHSLGAGRSRKIRIGLLGGFFMWIDSLYCEPKKSVFRRANPDASGLYIELAQFGFAKGVTPAVESAVARQAALSMSLETAKVELSRNGLTLDIKAVRRIANQCGVDILKLRKYWLALWRQGSLTAGDELSGKRVTVQIDGGRTRTRTKPQKAQNPKEKPDENGMLRSNAPGRSRKRSRSTFNAQWREPKLCTIFVHDNEGRMIKHSRATIDGTLEGPDAIAEIVAMHLYRLGAAKALSITFAADGASWIWNRIERIVSDAKIPETVKIYQVLDCCHATHHISLALAELGLNDAERMPLYRGLRTMLRNGQWQQVVDDLMEFWQDNGKPAKMATEIEYLRKHGEARRMSYVHFRKLGIPLGSGAIESGIRRVINKRMKSNGMFWLEENAEIMLQLRCQVISDRWGENIAAMRNMKRKTSLSDWRWIPQPMSCKVEDDADNQVEPMKTQGKK
jgi:hypothetical protein